MAMLPTAICSAPSATSSLLISRPLASDMLLVVPHLAAIYFAWRGRAFWSGFAAGIGLLCSSKAVFVLASGRGYQEVDRFGVILRHVARHPRGMPVLDPPGSALRGSPAVLAAAAVLHELPARLARSVRAIDAASATSVTLRLHGKITIVWGGTGQPAAKARELAKVARRDRQKFDCAPWVQKCRDTPGA